MVYDVFKKAVESISEIKDCYCSGIHAVKGNERKMINYSDPQKLSGSVDIDSALRDSDPDGSRWDYVVGYENTAYFIEVHPACTSDVTKMIDKVDWLKRWLKEKANQLNEICDKTFYWIPSGRVGISKSSPQYKILSQKKIRIESRFCLPPK